MPPPTAWSRLRETRLVQALVVYLAAAWVTAQAVSLFSDAFDWPKWVTRGTIVVLAAGLVATLLLVWAQSRAQARAAMVEGEAPPRSRPLLAGAVAISLVIVGAALWFVVRDRGRALGPDEALASAAPGIAILPFSVNDAELARWREGMVDLLATNLDGAGGLRSIDSRTVLARWRERVGEQGNPDLATSLDVARLSGGRFALVGSVVSSGTNMRILADVYDLEKDDELGQEMVEGSPDSIFLLVDRLSIAVLGRILSRQDGELPRVDLASITTTSVPALKSFLEGEALARRSDFERAIPAYESALAADSTFALAAFRLGQAYGWIEGLQGNQADSLYARAERFAARLPERDRDALDTALAYTRGESRATERVRALTQKYPDDPHAWFLLGDVYFHLSYQTLVSKDETAETFQRAIRLDPSYTPAYIHLIDLAFQRADSAALSDLLARYDALASGSAYDVRYALAYDLAFGDPAARAAAGAALDTLSIQNVTRVVHLLSHPRFVDLQARLVSGLRERPDAPALVFPLLPIRRGRIQEAVAVLEGPDLPPGVLGPGGMWLLMFEAQVPEGFYDRIFDSSAPDERGFGAAMLAIEEGRWSDVEKSLQGISEAARQMTAAGDSVTGRRIEAAATALRGRAEMVRGNDERALEMLETAFRESGIPLLPKWIAELHAEAGRPEEAVRYLETYGPDPWIAFDLAPLYEELGEREKAMEAYGWITLAWNEADPELQPRVVEAERQVARLRGLQRG